MKFKLEIQLGNDGMSTRIHLIRALNEVAIRIGEPGYPVDQEIDKGIRDENGNTVGSFHLVKE